MGSIHSAAGLNPELDESSQHINPIPPVTYKVFQKELHNGIPNITVW
jgi:hypothetical protein